MNISYSNPRFKPEAISGYTEWLPEVRHIELQWMDHIRKVFESYGFCPIETPSVEAIDALVAKGGETDKEIYALRRLQEMLGESEPRVALHYDLTVPLARYVAQHYNDLVFPFKRYQMQRAWRGERPQEGRFREFYQCDIDIVDNEAVSMTFDAELPLIVYKVLKGLNIGPFSIHINNRKVLQGFYEGLGIKHVQDAIRVADKFDKIGAAGVYQSLVDELGLVPAVAEKCVALAKIKTPDTSFESDIRALGVNSVLLDQGIEELRFVLRHLEDLPHGYVWADLSIARGLDYYTGTVYEGKLTNYPTYPSICSGGRYENLVGAFLRRKLPGVGMSIGLTRIFSKLLKEGQIAPGPKCPTDILVVFPPGLERAHVHATAERYREQGCRVEMYHEDKKPQEQVRYASRKGIPYVIFPGTNGEPDQVKDMATSVQAPVSPGWLPSRISAPAR